MGYCKLFHRICTGSECTITPPEKHCEYFSETKTRTISQEGRNYVQYKNSNNKQPGV